MTRLTLVRVIPARPSIVFEAITTAEGVSEWWGPDDLPVVGAELDARVGGGYRVHFRTVDGREHEVRGEYLEVVPPRRIVMSWRWAFGGEPDEAGRTSQVEIDLAPVAGGTQLTLTHTELWSEVSANGHVQGWAGSLDNLIRYMECAGTPAHNLQKEPQS